jgi:hypothetical protein
VYSQAKNYDLCSYVEQVFVYANNSRFGAVTDSLQACQYAETGPEIAVLARKSPKWGKTPENI